MFKRVTENDKGKTKLLKLFEGVAFQDENTIRREI
jgi:hypothetical protein